MREVYTKEDGMTLIETVLYIALFAIIFMSVMNFAFSVTEHNQEAEARTMIQRSIIQIQEHLTEKIDSATSIDTIASVFEVDNGVLSMTVSGSSAVYQISDGRLTYSTGGNSTPISSSKMIVTRFYIQEVLGRADQVTGVRITMEIQSVKGEESDTMITSFLL